MSRARAVLGVTRSGRGVHVYSGGADPGRALCGVVLVSGVIAGALEPDLCGRCVEKAGRYDLAIPTTRIAA